MMPRNKSYSIAPLLVEGRVSYENFKKAAGVMNSKYRPVSFDKIGSYIRQPITVKLSGEFVTSIYLEKENLTVGLLNSEHNQAFVFKDLWVTGFVVRGNLLDTELLDFFIPKHLNPHIRYSLILDSMFMDYALLGHDSVVDLEGWRGRASEQLNWVQKKVFGRRVTEPLKAPASPWLGEVYVPSEVGSQGGVGVGIVDYVNLHKDGVADFTNKKSSIPFKKSCTHLKNLKILINQVVMFSTPYGLFNLLGDKKLSYDWKINLTREYSDIPFELDLPSACTVVYPGAGLREVSICLADLESIRRGRDNFLFNTGGGNQNLCRPPSEAHVFLKKPIQGPNLDKTSVAASFSLYAPLRERWALNRAIRVLVDPD